MNDFLNDLGYQGEDCITGFKGIVSSVCFDVYGCVQYCLVSKVDKNGEHKSMWCDAKRVTTNKKKRVMTPPLYEKETPFSVQGPNDSRPVPFSK